ncbi:hypothetical protein [Flavobacterium celericrescens]|uniref:NTF2 fold immunity protein domain-containing protein n=1 Tax=Flavobacterium celericrescens TaxID=2709780 RepID=A0ABX0IAX6_9FLAO|nr:hypothetical protein [Flavobacterium celericrescens]NHM03746.1 hypothetical protein [Flavobacterium celericrescens]
MRIIYLVILSLFLQHRVVSQESSLNTPSKLTIEFIKDYKKWNDLAYGLNQNGKEYDIIEKEYKKIISKYCLEGKIHQGISFGSDSNHCPEREKIIKEDIKTDRAIIITKFKDKVFDYLESDYEYHYIKVNEKWFLEEIYLIDEEGKYEGL